MKTKYEWEGAESGDDALLGFSLFLYFSALPLKLFLPVFTPSTKHIFIPKKNMKGRHMYLAPYKISSSYSNGKGPKMATSLAFRSR